MEKNTLTFDDTTRSCCATSLIERTASKKSIYKASEACCSISFPIQVAKKDVIMDDRCALAVMMAVGREEVVSVVVGRLLWSNPPGACQLHDKRRLAWRSTALHNSLSCSRNQSCMFLNPNEAKKNSHEEAEQFFDTMLLY